MSVASNNSQLDDSILFSVIISNYNKADNIVALLSSIFDYYYFQDLEVIFMDDSSTDSSVEKARMFPVRLHVSEKKSGPATLRNIAAKKARGKYLLFIDSDVIVSQQTLINFRKIVLSENIGAIQGLEVLPPVVDNWIGTFRTLQVQFLWGKERYNKADVESWGATFGAVSKEIFWKAGGFNEKYRGPDVEDHELALKIKPLTKITFYPNLTYRHTYAGFIELCIKQFRRAAMICMFNERVIAKSNLYGWRHKINHVLTTVILLGIVWCLTDYRYGIIVVAALLMDLIINNFIYTQAIACKSILFAIYCFIINRILSLFIMSGVIYGKISSVLK